MEKLLPPEVAQNTGYLLSRLGIRARRLFADAIAGLGIRPPHFGILSLVGEHGALAQRELADGLALDEGQLVGLLDELERDGLVTRQVDARDRRRRAITLTAEGERRLRDARAAATAAEGQLVAGLSPDEREELRRLLLRLTVE